MCNFLIFLFGFALFNWFMVVINASQDWELVLQKLEHSTTNPDVFKFDMRLTRQSPGVYAIHGTVTAGVDIDDTYLCTMIIYRSAVGNGQYTITPYQIHKTTLYKFMTTVYVKMLQKDLTTCSDLPQYEEEWDEPFKKGTYTLNMCTVTNEGMPKHLQPGFYKIFGELTGENLESATIAIYLKVETKI